MIFPAGIHGSLHPYGIGISLAEIGAISVVLTVLSSPQALQVLTNGGLEVLNTQNLLEVE